MDEIRFFTVRIKRVCILLLYQNVNWIFILIALLIPFFLLYLSLFSPCLFFFSSSAVFFSIPLNLFMNIYQSLLPFFSLYTFQKSSICPVFYNNISSGSPMTRNSPVPQSLALTHTSPQVGTSKLSI